MKFHHDDIVAEFHSPFAGSTPSCSVIWVDHDTNHVSLSFPPLAALTMARHGRSAQRQVIWPTLRTHVYLITILQLNAIVVPSQCYNTVMLWSPRRYRRSWSYDSGAKNYTPVKQLAENKPMLWYGIVEFNVPLDTLYVISETVLQVTWPNQQCHSTEQRWLVNHVKGQSHQAPRTKRQREGCKQKKI